MSRKAFLLLAALLLLQGAFAQIEPPVPVEEPPEPVPVSLSFDPVLDFFGGIYNSIASVPQAVTDAFFNSLKGIVASFTSPILGLVQALLLHNIEPLHFQNLWLVIVSIISLCYGLLFLLVGFKFLLGSYDAVQRASAKEWLKNAIVIVVAVNASLLLYSLMLSLSSGLAAFLWDSELQSLLSEANLGDLNLLWVVLFAVNSFFAVITLFLRQVLLVAGVMLFPIGLFLYLIPPVRAFGYTILAVLAATAFMQVVDVIILVAVNLVVLEFAGFEVIGLLGTALALNVVAIANIAMFLMALFSGLGMIGREHPTFLMVGRAAAAGAV